MTAGNRLSYNNQGGALGADPGVSGTTLTFGLAPNFATLTGGQYIPIILDPGLGTFEIVYLTAYTSGQTTGTMTRQAEDSGNWPEVAHPSGTWVQAPTYLDNIASTLFKARVFRNSALTPGVATAIAFDTVVYDPSTSFSAGIFTCPVAGFYAVTSGVAVQCTATGQNCLPEIAHNGTVAARANYDGIGSAGTSNILGGTVSDIIQCAAGDTLDTRYQGSTSLALVTGTYETFMAVHLLSLN